MNGRNEAHRSRRGESPLIRRVIAPFKRELSSANARGRYSPRGDHPFPFSFSRDGSPLPPSLPPSLPRVGKGVHFALLQRGGCINPSKSRWQSLIIRLPWIYISLETVMSRDSRRVCPSCLATSCKNILECLRTYGATLIADTLSLS
jgi:hypothetical protein